MYRLGFRADYLLSVWSRQCKITYSGIFKNFCGKLLAKHLFYYLIIEIIIIIWDQLGSLETNQKYLKAAWLHVNVIMFLKCFSADNLDLKKMFY